MPSEMRYIQFSPAEVVQAVREFLRRRGQAFPPGTVTSCGPMGDTEEIAQFRMVVTGIKQPQIGRAPVREPERNEVVIQGETLKAALVLFCRDLKIPLPAAVPKSLRYVDPQVCLLMTMSGSASESVARGPAVIGPALCV